MAIFIVVTNAHSWGKGFTVNDAKKNAFKNNYMNRKECKYRAYEFPESITKNPTVDCMGNVNWEWATGKVDGFNPTMGTYRRAANGHCSEITE